MLTKRITQLKIGDMVDLEGDKYADQEGGTPRQFEYATVLGFERETQNCIRVDFEDGTSVGFPPNHVVKMAEA